MSASRRCWVLSSCRSVRHYSEHQTALLPSRINSPTTLPPALILPAARKSAEYRIAYAYRVGKSYLAFYKAGVKQILANRKTVKTIRALHFDHPLIRSIPGTIINHKTGQVISVDKHVERARLSRAEYQLVRRHAKDIKKVPVFAVLLAIFGEWLPLFVIFLDPLIPGTVLLPRQVLKRRRKSSMAMNADKEPSSPHRVRGDLEGAGIHDRTQLVTIAQRFGLLGPVSRYYTASSILQRIRRHERYLAIDDHLLLQETPLPLKAMPSSVDTSEMDTKVEALDEKEVELAIEERGMWSEKQTTEERLSLLNEWLETTNRDDFDAMVSK